MLLHTDLAAVSLDELPITPISSVAKAAIISDRQRRTTLIHSRRPSTIDGGATADGRQWWKESAIYQIYPSSFCDSNGDGLGDLGGITTKLDYLQSLGIDCLWLCPIYDSPQVDMGYDIRNYREIYAPYGTMQDFDEMLEELHARDMKLIMDLVVNHTSDLHPWFIESKSSLTNAKRDWYIWRPPKIATDGSKHPPNNWLSVFRGGSAWEYDAETDSYYLHLFVKEQPDLNWENPEVRAAVYDLMRFWLDKGVDGFRMDVINLIAKAPGLPDVAIIERDENGVALLFQPSFEHTANQPRVHEYLKEMNEKVLSHYQVLTVGETPFGFDPAVLIPYILPSARELQQIFHFELAKMDAQSTSSLTRREWKLSELKQIIGKWQTAMFEAGSWNAIYLENHDQARSISRFGNDSPEYRAVSAKMLAVLQVSLCGTIYIYQGQELGQVNIPKNWPIEEYKDVATITQWNVSLAQRRLETGEENPSMDMRNIQAKARDNSRTPQQWDSSPNAGFTAAGTEPWMRIHDDYKQWNATTQAADPESVYNFWRKAFAVRRESKMALVYGKYTVIDAANESVYAFIRSSESTSTITILNFTSQIQRFILPADKTRKRLLLANYAIDDEMLTEMEIKLRAYESRIYEI